ncbi:hypothetical protein APSETT444_009922 [Aspergillus pseudonomiae]
MESRLPSKLESLSTAKSDQVVSSKSNWVVQKFGGTSVGKFALNIIDQVVLLLRAARDAENAESKNYVTFVEAVRLEHVEVVESQISSKELRLQLVSEINDECEKVLKVLEAAQTLGEISARCVDKVMSTGEKLSCRLMAAFLQDRGVDSEYVDLAEIVDFTISSQGLDQEFYNNLASTLGKKIQACEGRVPVVTGFFGTIPGGLLDQIGRGYTDLCAALVAVGICAKELQVWKEVDGIFTADPRKVPTARILPAITPAEAAELTFYGSEVIHPFTMEQVIRAKIPIRIKNVMNPKGNGTIIFPDSTYELEKTAPGHDPRLFRTRSPSLMQTPKRPTAVTIKHKILVINVHSNKRSLSHGFFAGIFSVLDRWRLSIDLISTSEVHVSMALHSESPLLNGVGRDEYQIIDEDLKGALRDLQKYGTVDIIPEMAILSLVGKQMKNMIGVAGRMFTTLGENNVNIEMISQDEPPSDNFADFPEPSFHSRTQLKRTLMDAAPLKERPAKRPKREDTISMRLPEPHEMPPIEDDGTKPPYSYATLIGMSILRASNRRLTLAQIYRWISDTFSYYKNSDPGWQNSIRHNLSLNKAFIKQERPKDDPGKGNYWAIEPGMEAQFLKDKPLRRATMSSIPLPAAPQRELAHSQSSATATWTVPSSTHPLIVPKSSKNVDLSSDATLPASDPALQDDTDLDIEPPRIKRGRAEEEIARIRSSSHDISPGHSGTLKDAGLIVGSSPLRSEYVSMLPPPLTPVIKFKKPAKPPPSVSPNTNLRNHRKKIQQMVNSPIKHLGLTDEDLPWSPAFNIQDETFTPNDNLHTTFDVFADTATDNISTPAFGSPGKRSAKRSRSDASGSNGGVLADITAMSVNSRIGLPSFSSSSKTKGLLFPDSPSKVPESGRFIDATHDDFFSFHLFDESPGEE